MHRSVPGYVELEQAGLLDVADAYRRVADLAVRAAAEYASGIPHVESREQLDAALDEVERRVRRLEAARRGYGRIEAARLDRLAAVRKSA